MFGLMSKTLLRPTAFIVFAKLSVRKIWILIILILMLKKASDIVFWTEDSIINVDTEYNNF